MLWYGVILAGKSQASSGRSLELSTSGCKGALFLPSNSFREQGEVLRERCVHDSSAFSVDAGENAPDFAACRPQLFFQMFSSFGRRSLFLFGDQTLVQHQQSQCRRAVAG